MATQIAGLNYYELDFNADGTLGSDGGLPAAVQAGGIRDVFVMSHGWNAGVDSARSLYQAMFTLLAGMIPGRLGTSIAVGVIWPSLLFPDDDPATAPHCHPFAGGAISPQPQVVPEANSAEHAQPLDSTTLDHAQAAAGRWRGRPRRRRSRRLR